MIIDVGRGCVAILPDVWLCIGDPMASHDWDHYKEMLRTGGGDLTTYGTPDSEPEMIRMQCPEGWPPGLSKLGPNRRIFDPKALRMTVTVGFFDEAIESFNLRIAEAADIREAPIWSERTEKERKRLHVKFLKKTLGRPPYEYEWGEVSLSPDYPFPHALIFVQPFPSVIRSHCTDLDSGG